MTHSTKLLSVPPGQVYYPDSEEDPMGETDFHAFAMIMLREGLEDFFAPRRRVYVAANLFLYYVEGSPSHNKSPDAMVVKGVEKHFRRVFKTWEEGAVPCTAFEITSERTWQEDVGPKFQVYQRIGIKEYILFDPEGESLNPRLQGFRLRRGEYQPLPSAADGSLGSKELGLRLVPEGLMLRLIDLKTGKPVLTRAEQAEQARQQAAALAAEVERLRAALAKAEAGKKSGRGGKKNSP
jgi:Uma2 family endonuclease